MPKKKKSSGSAKPTYYNEVKKGMYDNAIKSDLSQVQLKPKQVDFFKMVKEKDVTFCTGPSGSGKTYLALFSALNMVADDNYPKIKGITLSKPIQEAGENIGFLPGTLEEKIHNHMESYHGNLNKLLDEMTASLMLQDGVIDFKPLAYQRGINQDGVVMLLDEAQNASFEQLMLFLTRMGEGSKAIIFGDVTQSDVAKRRFSFPRFVDIMKGLDGVGTFEFDTEDIVRHSTLQGIVERYQKYLRSREGDI